MKIDTFSFQKYVHRSLIFFLYFVITKHMAMNTTNSIMQSGFKQKEKFCIVC